MSLYDIRAELDLLRGYLKEDATNLNKIRGNMDAALKIPMGRDGQNQASVSQEFTNILRKSKYIADSVDSLRTRLSEIYVAAPFLKKCIDEGYVEICTRSSYPDNEDEDHEDEGDPDDYDEDGNFVG
jgi:hypothetical protein